MTQGTELAHAAINELEERLLDTLQARQAAMLASSMAEAIALQELAEKCAKRAASSTAGRPNRPNHRAVAEGGAWRAKRTTSPDEAPKPRKVSIPDNAGLLIGDVPTLDSGEDAEPVKRTCKRKHRPRTDLPANAGPDTPLRLAVAAKLAFPDGGVTAASLRREARAGRLVIERIAGKDFTTLTHIENMRRESNAATKQGSTSLARTRRT